MSDPKPFSSLDLEPAVLEALNQMGYETMTPVQEKSIPHLLTSVDFLGQAPTGTGKTAAFSIPLVNKIETGTGYIQALIIAPTRELAQQIAKEINEIGKVKGVKALAVFGGERIYGQKKRLQERDIDIVVGTPGRLLDHLGQLSLNFTRTRHVILDECDEMLDMGFLEDIEDILSHTPQGRQTWLFSATMSDESLKVAKRHLLYPEEVRIKPQRHTAEVIDQFYYILDDAGKIHMIKNLLEEEPDLYGIVFCQTKRKVMEVIRQLWDDYPVEALHGALPQSNRDSIMERFRDKEYKLVVATDVLARGIDIDCLTHIINYDPPSDPEAYIHRIGRTARAGEEGIAITLFEPHEEDELKRLEARVGMPITQHPDNQGVPFTEGRPRRGRGRGSSGSGSHGRPRRSSGLRNKTQGNKSRSGRSKSNRGRKSGGGGQGKR